MNTQNNLTNSRCPFSPIAKIRKLRFSHKRSASLGIKIYNKINNFCLRVFKSLWFPQYVFAIYPGVIAHHKDKKIKEKFYQFTVKDGHQASHFFEYNGIASLARNNNGICSFWLDKQPVIYQVTNQALVQDELLSPSTGPNKHLFGEFMGTLPGSHPKRKLKRQPLLKTLANPNSLESFMPHIQSHVKAWLKNNAEQEHSLELFTMKLVAHIDSYVPGILDVTQKTLTTYLESEEYSDIMRNFFDYASDVISKLDHNAFDRVKSICPFVKNLLIDNFESIADAPASNIIKQYFQMYNLNFSQDSINNLSEDYLKELGTIIVAVYDTTSLSLFWAICYIETHPHIKNQLLKKLNDETDTSAQEFIYLIILETLRLAGGNPTALWREVVRPTYIEINNNKLYVKKGTILWLDRRAANQDPAIFPDPSHFNPENIAVLIKQQPDSILSLLNSNRYEINSFNMVNTLDSPRKCPGRFFSVFVQSVILKEIYTNYDTDAQNISTKMRRFSAMPRPEFTANIIIHAKK